MNLSGIGKTIATAVISELLAYLAANPITVGPFSFVVGKEKVTIAPISISLTTVA